jgi:hypothetical protein
MGYWYAVCHVGWHAVGHVEYLERRTRKSMKTQIHTPLPSAGDTERYRTIQIGEHEISESAILFNGGPGDYRDKLFAIYVPCGNFSHCLGVLWAAGEHEVLNDACDAGLLDSLKVEDKVEESEAKESTAWLGNASEPFDLPAVSIVRIPDAVWQADWQFVHALGRCAGGADIETGADI